MRVTWFLKNLIHTTIYKIKNKNLLYSTENSTQYSAIGLYEKIILKRVGLCLCITFTFCPAETNTTLQINYIPAIFLKHY